MYEKVSKDLNFVDREKEVEKFWRDQDIFRKSIEQRSGCPTYMCYQGYDSEIPYNERVSGTEEGGVGYPRSSR